MIQTLENMERDDRLKLLTLQAKIQRKQGNQDEAAKTLREIVETDGTQGEALLELAEYYWDDGQQELALMKVEQAQVIKATRFVALTQHAQFLVSMRKYYEAADLLWRALQIRDEPRHRRFLERVEEAARSRRL